MATTEVTSSANGSAPTTPTKRWSFFSDTPVETPPGAIAAAAAPYNAARGMTGAAEVLNLALADQNRADRSIQAWQTSAWDYVDQIGELKFAFNIVSQVVSRAMLYPAILDDLAEVPTEVGAYLDKTKPEVPDVTKRATEVAAEVLTELLEAGQAEMLRLLSINLSVPGECYLLKDKTWTVASTSELTIGKPTWINRSKKSENRRQLAENAYVARMWRAHPRYYSEPDSSMLGVLDQCVDSETEIYTRQGWKKGEDVLVGEEVLTLNHETGVAEWQVITDFTYRFVENEPMYRFQGKLHDSLTTDGHRWPIVDRHGHRRWTTSENFPRDGRVTLAAPMADLPTEAKYTDDLVELAAWWWTEGSILQKKPNHRLMLTLSQSAAANPGHLSNIRNCLTRLFGPPSEGLRGVRTPAWREGTPKSNDVVEFFLNAEASDGLAAIFEDLGEKVISREFLQALTQSQLDLFIGKSMDADGAWRKKGYGEIHQISERRIDRFEEACILAGRSYKRWGHTPSEGGFSGESPAERHVVTLFQSVRSTAQPRVKKDPEIESYTGYVWCPTTPNGTWLARRNGKVFYTGNCEKVVLFDQVIRALSRSRLGAGVIAIPSGLTPVIEGLTLEQALAKATVDPVESEAAAASVVPLLLTGPAEQIDKIKRIDLSRPLEEPLLQAYDSALDRMLAGLDIPKNIVTGLADVKYSNALVIDDALYKAHIEPLLLLICDCLTNAYLRPRLRKEGIDEKLVKRMVIWYNPSQIVTRPDRSQAASEGYEKMLLSGKAWRAARGFAETDAPDDDEVIRRKGLDAQVPGEMASLLIEQLHPKFFAKLRSAGRAEAGVPPEVSDMLDGGDGGFGTADNGLGGANNEEQEPGQVPGAKAPNDPMGGGEIPQGGTLPPRPTEETLQ